MILTASVMEAMPPEISMVSPVRRDVTATWLPFRILTAAVIFMPQSLFSSELILRCADLICEISAAVGQALFTTPVSSTAISSLIFLAVSYLSKTARPVFWYCSVFAFSRLSVIFGQLAKTSVILDISFSMRSMAFLRSLWTARRLAKVLKRLNKSLAFCTAPSLAIYSSAARSASDSSREISAKTALASSDA